MCIEKEWSFILCISIRLIVVFIFVFLVGFEKICGGYRNFMIIGVIVFLRKL